MIGEILRTIVAIIILSCGAAIVGGIFGAMAAFVHNDLTDCKGRGHEWYPFARLQVWIKLPFRPLRSRTSKLEAKLERAKQLEGEIETALGLMGGKVAKIPEGDPWRPHFETTLQEARRKKKETQMKLQEAVATSYAKRIKKIGG